MFMHRRNFCNSTEYEVLRRGSSIIGALGTGKASLKFTLSSIYQEAAP